MLQNIRCLQRQTWQNLEIIVVDNGSPSANKRALRAAEGIQLVELPQNYGPAYARNIGIQHATGDFVLLLDSDSFMGRTGVARLVERMCEDPTVGVVGCRILNWKTGLVDQWIYPKPYTTYGDREFETYSFSAAGAMLRTAAVRAAGGFWEELFMYNEEVDLSACIYRSGFKILYFPDVAVFHKASEGGRLSNPAYFRLQIRNWIWIFYRHYPMTQAGLRIVLMSAVYMLKGVLAGYPLATLTGIVEGVTGFHWSFKFPRKMNQLQIRQLAHMNQRFSIHSDFASSRRHHRFLLPARYRGSERASSTNS